MTVSFDFSGRVVIVTGAARGIGRVMVQRFAAAGASVVAADRDEAGLAETCASLDPERVASLVADVSTEAGAQRIVDAAVDDSASSTSASTTPRSRRTPPSSTSGRRSGTRSTPSIRVARS